MVLNKHPGLAAYPTGTYPENTLAMVAYLAVARHKTEGQVGYIDLTEKLRV